MTTKMHALNFDCMSIGIVQYETRNPNCIFLFVTEMH